MKDRLEDKMFVNALEAVGIVRTQDMYEPATYRHHCQMCGDTTTTYKLKPQYVEDKDYEPAYIYICSECFKELEV